MFKLELIQTIVRMYQIFVDLYLPVNYYRISFHCDSNQKHWMPLNILVSFHPTKQLELLNVHWNKIITLKLILSSICQSRNVCVESLLVLEMDWQPLVGNPWTRNYLDGDCGMWIWRWVLYHYQQIKLCSYTKIISLNKPIYQRMRK